MAITINVALPSGYYATYARALASPSIRLDSGRVEIVVALYKDAEARFAAAEPAGYETKILTLDGSERETITNVIYAALKREGYYPDGVPRDPDPEKQGVTV